MGDKSCLAFLQLLCCGTIRGGKKGGSCAKVPDSEKVKIRVGFDGKDTLMDPHDLNVKTVFGSFAVLLEYSSNQVVPLNSEGFVVGEPLDPRKRYVVVVNTHGSSKSKWDLLKKELKGGKHKHSSSKKKSKKNSSKSKKDSNGVAKEMNMIAANGAGGDDFTAKDFAASTQSLLTPNSTPNNSDDDTF